MQPLTSHAQKLKAKLEQGNVNAALLSRFLTLLIACWTVAEPISVVIAGGGAAGFFAAITCAQANPAARIVLCEKGPQFLAKVRISGGGRCNVTHACPDQRAFTARYPRGERALIGPFHRFSAVDTIQWFESRGVPLKVESDGRMFPVTDSSQTVIDCLLREARRSNVELRSRCGVDRVRRLGSQLEVLLTTGESVLADRVLLATGGCRTAKLGVVAESLGHTVEPPVPSLFTFHIETAWLRELAGVSVAEAAAAIPGTKLRERGPLLVTHWGLSGPVILKLSAWGAKELHARSYKFPLHVNWLPQVSTEQIRLELKSRIDRQPAKLVANAPIAPLSARLWIALVLAAEIPDTTRWAALSKAGQHRLIRQLTAMEFEVTGKSLNKDEFVTCGGVRLSEVDFKTMESKLCPGLYFAGELLDIDGLTGGFNFQAAWTTGWIAGMAMAR
jgi:predicted Rossmann fold flavoprotein